MATRFFHKKKNRAERGTETGARSNRRDGRGKERKIQERKGQRMGDGKDIGGKRVRRCDVKRGSIGQEQG